MKLAFGVTPGFCEILWRSVGDEPSSEFLPYSPIREDEERWVFFRYWHTLALGDLCWLLYEPALTYFNGWSNHPEELDLISVVNCELLEFHQPASHLEAARKSEPEARLFYQRLQEQFELKGVNSKASFSLPPANEIAGWAKVRCQRVISLSQIPLYFESRSVNPVITEGLLSSSERQIHSETAQLIGLLRREGQECSSDWIMTKSQPMRLVYYSLSLDSGRFEICNAPLPSENI